MRSVRKKCNDILRNINIPAPFEINRFCDNIAKHTGRDLKLLPVKELGSPAPCGMLLSTKEMDYIFYEPNTSRLHSDHIILHEIGHILWGHMRSIHSDGELLARLMPDLDPALVKRMLGRVRYSSEEEMQAEFLASLIRSKAGVLPDEERNRSQGVNSAMVDAFHFIR
ncbi:hypothetical protein RIF23_11480 [Lipingzhangella sp. LS1_29]|uniref:IrrE N-terminal-like domain-containing protein n=1 Tax=Lipingzhangella rawalii TaxID=2055835 RepID=A0ABU2H7W9_9ACTN|nr:hypothetical protein [Lipingzhangella rawalii]MDS1270920.1 hypothetical protein [Lipingzhangella rawalii]